MEIFRSKAYLLTSCILSAFILCGMLVLSCGGGGGGIAAIIGGAAIVGSIALSSSPVVGVSAAFFGERDQRPAAVLPFTSEAQAIAVTPDGGKILVTDALHNTVSFIDTDTRSVTAVLDVRTNPRFVAITPDGKKAYVSSFGLDFDDDSLDVPGTFVTVIDAVQETVLTHIQVANRPANIVFTPDGQKAYVAHTFFDFQDPIAPGLVSIINTSTDRVDSQVTLTHEGVIGQEATGMVISQDGNFLYVLGKRTANNATGSVIVFDTSTDQPVQIVTVGAGPVGIAMNPDGDRLYVTNQDDNSVSVFDISSGNAAEVDVIAVEDAPGPVVVSPDGKKTYVAHLIPGAFACPTDVDPDDPPLDAIGNRVTVIDTVTNLVLPAQITVGIAPLGMVLTPDSVKLYTISGCDENVSAIETATIDAGNPFSAKLIEVETRSTAIAISAKKPEVYAVHPHAVSVIDIRSDTVAKNTIAIRGDGPTLLTAGKADLQGRFKIYALHPGSNSVTVIESDNDIYHTSQAFIFENRPSSFAFTEPSAESLLVTISGFSKSTLFTKTLDNRVERLQTNPFGVSDILNTSPIVVGSGPIKVMTDTGKDRVFVAAFGHFFNNTREPSGDLSRIDLNTNNPITVDNGDSPNRIDLAKDQTNGRLYIADFLNATTNGKILSLELADNNPSLEVFTAEVNRPVSIGVSGAKLYSADYLVEGGQFRFKGFDVNDPSDASKNVDIPITGVNPSKIVFANVGSDNIAIVLQSGDRSYVCDALKREFCDIGAQVNLINLSTQAIETVPVGSKPVDAIFTADKIFVSGYFSDTVTVIDTTDMDFDNASPPRSLTLIVGKGPSSLIVKDRRVFVANSIDNTVSVISADEDFSDVSVIQTIPL